MSNYTQLQEVLTDIFELNKADLDFGIYRIMNQKRKEINQFIEETLPKDIKMALSSTTSSNQVELQLQLKEIEKSCADLGVVKEENAKYIATKNQLDTLNDPEAMEQEVFSHLANFFRRYYKDGDFISMRRYKKDVYAIPYEGEEVKLYWANHDQYYIKSSENFKNYSFLYDGKKINFNLKEASTEQNNNKAQDNSERRFAIYKELPVEEIEGELYINFIYESFPKSTKQEDLLKEALEAISQNAVETFSGIFSLVPTEKNKNRTLLEKHLTDFVSRNSFDYFIHKDLGGFLKRELDFYIKNEVLYIDDINEKQTEFFTAQLSKIKAIKVVSERIIDFLAQIENFQRKLWLKKKMVIRTDYLITLDRIPSTYYAEILENNAQQAEWKTLFDVEISTVEQLHFEQFLVLDTQFYSEAFKDKLLGEFTDLDENTNGLLINAENFQALNLLQEKYIDTIQQIYIDPPYNTGNDDGFVYKDNYQKSSWLSLIKDRLYLSDLFLKSSGTFSMSIDLKELDTSLYLLNNLYGEENRRNNISVKRSAISGPKVINPGVVNITENVLLYSKSGKEWREYKQFRERERDERYNTYIENFEENFENWRYISVLDAFSKQNHVNKKDLKKHFGNHFNDKLNEFVIKNAEKIIQFANLDENSVSKDAVIFKKKSIEDPGLTLKLERKDKDSYFITKGKVILFYDKRLIKIGDNFVPGEPLSDIWIDVLPNDLHNEGGVYLRKGKKPEKLVDRIVSIGATNKEIVLDYFAGSGTTGAVALKSNKRFINIEQGVYFKSITLNRIKNTLFGDKSGISKLYNWKGGGLVKYQILETYEDTLNNLFLKPTEAQQQIDFTERASSEYLLHYMLDVESREHLFNLEMFTKPFDYQLKVTENNELIPKKIDLVETFNYLIGLYVSKVQRVKDIKVVEGVTREGQKTLVIWRDLETTTHDEVIKLIKRFYDSQRTQEFHQIYINGDHHLDNLRQDGDQFKVKLIEETFFKKMFNETEL